MMGISASRALFNQPLGELLEQAIFADQVIRDLVVGQELIEQRVADIGGRLALALGSSEFSTTVA
ncbi:hypothetical protein [Abyssibacter sp.]|jgi:hypothetical protein|uniref:hypothetical protein n=1 Tax=Abyssibacter sp. TaxID=2320200 RepID=UPI0025BCDB01|nr:hypothetical protein [Abyssibacter sp.]MCK5858031.1 hypothetical protein [Abyssibacter sp.]